MEGKGDFNSMDILSFVWKKEGLRGMFRGNLMNMLRVAPLQAIEFYSFDYLKYFQFFNSDKNNSILK